MTSRCRGTALLATGAAVLLTSGCGFLEAVADPAPGETLPAPATTAPRTVEGPPLVFAADLTSAEGVVVRLSVHAGAAQTGLSRSRIMAGPECGLPDDATTTYVPVEITVTGQLGVATGTKTAAVDVSAEVDAVGPDGAAAPGVAVSVSARTDGTTLCTGDRPQQGDRFRTVGIGTGEQVSVTVFVAAGSGAGTPSAEALGGSVLRLTDLVAGYDVRPGPWRIGTPSAGATCPDRPDAVCIPL